MTTNNRFPDHELRAARAKKLHRERNRNLREIESDFRKEFYPKSPLHQVFMQGNREGIAATIFLNTDADVAACEANGTSEAMREFLYQKLAEYGRGSRDEIDVVFRFDSFESVQKNYDGDYNLRMS